jgi:hypothetical protein
MIKNLFYFLYWIYAKSESIKNPSLHSFVDICVILGFNLATFGFILFHFLDLSLANKGIDGGLWGLMIGVLLMIANYFTWYNKRQVIISQYKQMARKEKVRRSVFAIIYVVISLLSFYITAKVFLPWW